jgi:hypothetical protein
MPSGQERRADGGSAKTRRALCMMALSRCTLACMANVIADKTELAQGCSSDGMAHCSRGMERVMMIYRRAFGIALI